MAITLSSFGTGIFPEVSYSPVGDLWLVWQDLSGLLRVWKNGVEVHTVGFVAGQQPYPKMSGDTMILRGLTELPTLWVDVNQPYATTQILDGNLAAGTDPVVIGHGWIAWQRTTSIQRRLLSGGSPTSVGAPRPTGLSRITSSGSVVLVDTDRAQMSGGVVWGTRPSFAGTAIAAEGPSGGVVVRNGNDILLWAGQTSFTPRIARHPVSGDYAITTWGDPNGVRLAIITADEFTGGSPPPDPGGGGGGGTGGGRPTPATPRLGRTGPSPITPRAQVVRPSRPVYPHVGRVQDRDAQHALRILFERAHSVEQRLDASSGVDQQIADLSSQLAAVQEQLRANENALRGADAVAGARFGVGGSVDPIPVPDGGNPGGGSPGSGPGPGGPGGGTGTGGGTPSLPLPMLLSVVQDYANANPAELANSCQDSGGSWDFMDGVVDALRAVDPRFGYNCKRGNCNDPSHDAISYYWGSGAPYEGASQVYVVDIIGGHCGPNPTPTWTNQTGVGGARAGWTGRGRF